MVEYNILIQPPDGIGIILQRKYLCPLHSGRYGKRPDTGKRDVHPFAGPDLAGHPFPLGGHAGGEERLPDRKIFVDGVQGQERRSRRQARGPGHVPFPLRADYW